MNTRTLTLRRERLTELTDADLARVDGADATLGTCVFDVLDRLLHTRRPTECLCP